jgi:hypothetical protein
MLVIEELNDFILFVFDVFEFILICFLIYNQLYAKPKEIAKKKIDEETDDEIQKNKEYKREK